MSLRLDRSVEENDGDDGGASEAVLAAARTAAADIALITDSAQAVIYVSGSFTAMTGYAKAEMIGRNCRVLQGPGTDPVTRRQMRDVLASGEVFEGKILNYRKDGSAFWTALRITPLRVGTGPDITHFVSVQRDISNEVALVKQLEAQALHDYVTRLPNRIVAEQAVSQAVKRLPPGGLTVAVGLIDLDDFRLVNNTLGHAAGDAVLQQWSFRMLSRLREGDVLARMGGDEFLLILKNITRDTSSEDLTGILDRVHSTVEEPFAVNGQQVRIGMSLGIALVPEDGTDSHTILRSADEALYAAKKRDNHGTSWWVTAEQAHTGPAERNVGGNTHGSPRQGEVARPEDYRGALRSGNVQVDFQPVVDLRDESTHLFEALARLKLPDGRTAYPGEFLSYLGPEDQRALFAAVLEQALEVLGSWDREGARHNVSVNFPPEILQDRTIPALINAQLKSHRILPSRLTLELLETQVMDLEAQRIALHELAGLGIGLAMDDLGSGHSSLQRLSSFPFTAIKLDRGLLLHIYNRPLETLTIMATLIQMGRDMRMDVIIEGLEDESLTEAAIILGAPLGQGFYFAKPMPPEECIQWLDTFELQSHRSPIQTPLGALAYHWQFARLDAPHPLELHRCPVTRFISNATAGPEVESWHALQHSPQGNHPASSRLLIDWLTDHITTSTPQEVRPAPTPYPQEAPL